MMQGPPSDSTFLANNPRYRNDFFTIIRRIEMVTNRYKTVVFSRIFQQEL